MSANKNQVGGTHYNVGDKLKSVEDLKKAIHFLMKKIEMTQIEALSEEEATSAYVNQDR